MKIKLRGYIFSRDILFERTPQHVQNIVVREYCRTNNFQFLLSDVEYSIKNSYNILQGLLKFNEDIEGIVFYSLFQLPNYKITRNEIYKKILSKKKQIHFALENFKFLSTLDIEKIENIFGLQNNLNKSLKIEELKKRLNF